VGGSSVPETGSGQQTAGQLDAGDVISGGDDADVVLADNGLVTRAPAIAVSDLTRNRLNADTAGAPAMVLRSIQPYDLGDAPTAGTSGADWVSGAAGSDVLLGQSGNDRLLGGADSDYAEGGPGSDWIQGDAGNDDLVGGSSTVLGADTGITTQGQLDTGDVIFGGTGDDLLTGDNAVVSRAGTINPITSRVGSQNTMAPGRSLRLLDLSWSTGYLGAPTRAVYGADQLSGGAGVDVVLGQDGADQISGGAGDDYVEGNGGADTIFGDRTLAEAGIAITPPAGGWPGADPGADPGDVSGPNGQDDLIGGSSTAAFRDAADVIHGDGGSDFELGDNGTAVRDIVGAPGALTNRIYAGRYDPAAVPADAAFVRHGVAGASTRFCSTAQATCEPVGASGADTLFGDGGDDFMYGQDGNDVMRGGDGNDDMFGELGDDQMYGEAGNDAMVGDRGGIVDKWQSGANQLTVDLKQVPKIHYDGFLKGSVTRVTDLRHDVNGDTFAAVSSAAAMPHDGMTEGGNDRMRGGDGSDALHGGNGDDLMNGDSGGDVLFGDDGSDVIWGGKGGTDLANPNERGTNDSLVDYVFGGAGATSGPAVDPTTGVLGSDVLDWRPRGSYTPGVGCTTAPWPANIGTNPVDPCSWFEMTSMNDADPTNDQHHQGIDWMYGGMDRDVLQADVADNGPNSGDRLLDWDGAYNLYSHCNSAYGGYNDVRQHSPAMQSFLQQWSYSVGAGQSLADLSTSGTSAYDELALVYPGDHLHGSGSAYPSTPGHFDGPAACSP
jgi:Ca2+-binding RTX toxin-like protein